MVPGSTLGSLDGEAPTRLTPAAGAGVYLPSGWLLWVRTGTQTLVAQRLDIANAALTGEPVTGGRRHWLRRRRARAWAFPWRRTGWWRTGRRRTSAN